MEMIDVLKKLQEITDKSPEVAKAVENVKATNPKEVKENAVESEPAITEYKVGSYKDFLASKGIDIYKLKGDEHSKYAQLYKAEKERAHADATTHKGTDDHREISRIMKHEDEPTKEGGMSDVHIGAQEKVGEFIDADGNLSAPKQDVLQSLEQQRASAPFPESYEIEVAMKMVQDDFDDNGQAKAEYEPDPEDNIPHDVDTQMNMDAPAEEPKIEADYPSTLNINGMTTEEDVISMIQDTIDAGKGDDAKDYLEQLKQHLFVKSGGQAESEEPNLDEPKVTKTVLNTEAMTKETKKPISESKQPVKEAITMTADSPEEASMLMHIMKLAGVQQVTPDMVGAEPEATTDIPSNDADTDQNPEHGDDGHDHSDCPVCTDDAVGSGDMGKMRDMISQNDTDEKAEETWDNEPEEKVSDVDTLVNVHSGGLNKQKQQVRKEYPGDNPMAAEDKITEEEIANSFSTQYEDFKKSYQEAATPDFLDMDKAGNKKEPMKKAVSDKEAK